MDNSHLSWVATGAFAVALAACGGAGQTAPEPATRTPSQEIATAHEGTTYEKERVAETDAGTRRLSGTGDTPKPAPPPAAPPADPEIPSAMPNVVVKNIGLHIGGGPNDAATKAPFLRAVEKRFDDFRRCYGKVEKPGARGTFGIDLLVPKEGGRAATSNSRTALPGAAFRDCVAHVFETVEFERPKLGATKLSYALSFDPPP